MNEAEQDRLTNRTIIPAEEGWTIVRYSRGFLCSPERIIAWAIEHWEGEWNSNFTEEDRSRLGPMRTYYAVIPITVEGAVDNFAQEFAIKEPKKGWYILPHDSSFKERSDLIAHLQEVERINAETKSRQETNPR